MTSTVGVTGLEAIHQLTSQCRYDLRVELEDWEGLTATADYDGFALASAADKYRMHVDNFTGGSAGKESLCLHSAGKESLCLHSTSHSFLFVCLLACYLFGISLKCVISSGRVMLTRLRNTCNNCADFHFQLA